MYIKSVDKRGTSKLSKLVDQTIDIVVVGEASEETLAELGGCLSPEFGDIEHRHGSSLGAIDLPLVMTFGVSFVASSLAGGIMYDAMKASIASVVDRRKTSSRLKDVIIEIQSPNGRLHISEFETYFESVNDNLRESCDLDVGLDKVLNDETQYERD